MKAINMQSRISILLLILLVFSCKKDEPENPYANIPPVIDVDNPDADNLPEGSFAWLQEKVFRPTCANSGCHDGTFEPEFRSISSSYNSLVNHPVIANDETNSFEFRVVPGNADVSFLHERLTVDIPNTSGQMPLVGNDDWDSNSASYIQKIVQWINDGAKDMYGNPAPPAGADYPPLIYGFAVFPHDNTTTPYVREESDLGIGPFLVDADLVDVWILPYDLETPMQDLAATVKWSESVSDFTGTPQANYYISTPITATDFGDQPNSFIFKATIDLSAEQSGTTFYLRNFVDDGVQQIAAEIPNSGSNYFWYLLFSMKVM